LSISFDSRRWECVIENSEAWWKGELKRPLMQFYIPGRDPERPEPSVPFNPITAFYDRSVSAEEIVDAWDYQLACTEFLGDAFPYVWPNFGPGVTAAFVGANLELGNNTVWFHPNHIEEITHLDFKFDPDNYWFLRIKDICKAAAERWNGSVQVSTTDIGGALDIISSFRPAENLLFDLVDDPDTVKRLTWQVHDIWWSYFEEFAVLMEKTNPGFTSWTPIFSKGSSYMLQCDFSAMISPDMFEEFALPELQASCKRMVNPFYHLDGPGEIPHLDHLLSISELKGIQWVPTKGPADMKNWPELYRKIRNAGKLIQIAGTPDVLDAVVEQLGSGEGIVFIGTADSADAAMECLRRHGA